MGEVVRIEGWATEGGDEDGVSRDPRRRGKGRKVEHPELGTIYAGASDHQGHRTTISIPQSLGDRAHRIVGEMGGTVYGSMPGLLRDALHARIDTLEKVGLLDLSQNPGLKQDIELDRAAALTEQTIATMQKEERLVSSTVAALEACYASDNAEMLERMLGEAEKSLELLSPTNRKHLESQMGNYRRKGEGLMR